VTEETKTIETTETTTGSPDSSLTAFGHSVSFRGLLALSLVITLCALSLLSPEIYAKPFENIVTAVVFFYFGQATKK
jgi:hypothetical protein